MEIRALQAGDGPAIHHTLLGDPEIATWFRSDGPFTLAECGEFVTKKVAHRVAHGFGWSLGWQDDACVASGLARYCVVDGASEVEMATRG